MHPFTTELSIQELILSTIYISETLKILRGSFRRDTRRLMHQLVLINIVIIIMDVALIGIEYASRFLLESIVKGLFYSIKLKLEFAILGRLVQFVGSDQGELVGPSEAGQQLSVVSSPSCTGRSPGVACRYGHDRQEPEHIEDFQRVGF